MKLSLLQAGPATTLALHDHFEAKVNRKNAYVLVLEPASGTLLDLLESSEALLPAEQVLAMTREVRLVPQNVTQSAFSCTQISSPLKQSNSLLTGK